jgi:hypothetical protein
VIEYFRSSSVSAWNLCNFKLHLNYTMGIEDRSGKAAHQGNAVHKALELAARCQVARQRGEATFREDETGVEWPTDAFDYDAATDAGFTHYQKLSNYLNWTGRDLIECRKWTRMAVEYNGGLFDPLKRTVIEPERFFDLELPFDWAVSGTGQRLRMKGTLDLLLAVDGEPGAIELTDWKTGRRWDWARDEEKTYRKLCRDHQLLMVLLCRPDAIPGRHQRLRDDCLD